MATILDLKMLNSFDKYTLFNLDENLKTKNKKQQSSLMEGNTV